MLGRWISLLFLFGLHASAWAKADDSTCEQDLTPIFFSYNDPVRDPNKRLLLSDRFAPGQEILLQSRARDHKKLFVEKRIGTRARAGLEPWLNQLTTELIQCTNGEGPPPCQSGNETGAIIVEFLNGQRCIARAYGKQLLIEGKTITDLLNKCLQGRFEDVRQVVGVHTHPEVAQQDVIAFHSDRDLRFDRDLYKQITDQSPKAPYRSLVVPMGRNEDLIFEAVYSPGAP